MEIIKIKSDEHWHSLRAEDLTSTDMAALFDMSPYLTHFELWHRKKEGVIPEFNSTERMKWGNRLEQAIAEGIAEDNDMVVEPMKDYYRNQDLKLGSSFDYSIESCKDFEGKGILEIKNVDSFIFKSQWQFNEDGVVIEAPPHIELQVQHQLAVSGRDYAYIGALVGGNEHHILKRKADTAILSAITMKSMGFWDSIKDGKAPDIDYEKDADFLISLSQHAEPNTLIEANETVEELATEYREISSEIKRGESKKREIKAKILGQIGEAEKVTGSRFTISCGLTESKEIPAFTRKGFRNFRINWRKK
jgi:putative phage-type endonuclease